MDIKSIKQIVNSDLPIDYQEKAILSILANDKKVIPYIMEILENERKQNKKLLLDTNMELSRALITLTANPSDVKGKKAMKEQTDFVVGEIKKHYLNMSRRLTGKWYLKKKLFGFIVMVETVQTTTCEFDFSTSPEFIRWEKAKESDFLELGINCA